MFIDYYIWDFFFFLNDDYANEQAEQAETQKKQRKKNRTSNSSRINNDRRKSFPIKSPFNISHIVIILFSIVHTLCSLYITRTKHKERKKRCQGFTKMNTHTHIHEKKK